MTLRINTRSATPVVPLETGSTSQPTPPPVTARATEPPPVANPAAPKSAPGVQQAHGLKTRIAGKLSERQTNFSLGIPGTGRTLNRPLRSGIPEEGEQVSNEESHDPLLKEAHELQRMVESALTHLKAAPTSLWERPAPSTVRRITTKVFPWLKPAPLREVASNGSNAKIKIKINSQQSPETIAAAVKELSTRLDHQSKVLATATHALVAAREHLESLEQATPPTSTERLDHARARVQQADSTTRLASQQLRELIQGTEVLQLGALSEGQDQVEQKAEFSQQWLGELRTRMQAVDVRFADRHAAIEIELQLKVAETRELISLDHDMTAAEHTAAQANTQLSALRAQRQETPEGSDEADRLDTAIGQTLATRSQAMQTHQQLAKKLVRVDADVARLNDELGEIHQRIAIVNDERFALKTLDQKLPASEQVAAPAEDQAQERIDKTALKNVREQYLASQIGEAHAFAATGADEIQAALQRIGDRLQGTPPPTPLPAFAVIEVVTSALADVTGNDATRANRVLDMLNQHPLEHWPRVAEEMSKSVRTRSGNNNSVQRDALDLCRKLANVPRGMEMLQVLSSDGTAPIVADRAKPLRVFWNADEAQQKEPDGKVKAWLQTAKQVARSKLDGDDKSFDDVDHAAFNAVRNGYFSNAPGTPYAQHDQRLKKATMEWVMRAVAANTPEQATATAPTKSSLPRRLVPTLNKTPFAKSTLDRAYSVGESMGLQSPRKQVDQVISARISMLEETLKNAKGAPGLQLEISAAHAMLDHLKSLEKKGTHLSQVTLKKRDGKSMQSLLKARVQQQRLSQIWDKPDANGKRAVNVLHKAQHIELPPLYSELANSKLSVYEALNRVDEHLREVLPPALQPAESVEEVLDQDLSAAIKLLKTRHLSEKSDIVTFFKPFILESRLRDRLRLGGGGTLGVGLPSLPYSLISPIVSPIFSAEKSRSDEAFAQLFMPILGMEMSFGKARTEAAEATIGVAAGSAVADGVAIQAALTGRFTAQETQTSSTLMRFFRTRHKDDEMRGNMLTALDSMVRWDIIDPQKGQRYAGPLEAILARNPEVSVSQIDATSSTRNVAARVALRVPAVRFKDGASHASQTLTPEPSVYVEADRIKETRTETGGFISVVGAKGDTAQQRMGVTANLNFAPIASSATPAEKGANHGVQGQGLGLQLGMSRDLAWALEKNEISPFLIGDKQDADLDRHYSTPRDMQAEITANRDLWLMRCIETLEPDETGNKNTPDNRLRAAMHLDAFEATIKRLGKDSKYCQYNVNYSMKGRAGAEIDGYRGIQALALQRGDVQAAEKAQQAIDDILLTKETWRPLVLIVRERARDSTVVGWRNLLRWQKLSNVDGQRTAAQFPPP
ncbi:type III effector HopAS1 [Pseudomonas syringae pv. persicae]|uniref:Type III effector HopAS1 n=2 Tax=Pseudomonas syringae group genomosp. 3 TaxID=251701 RepID=A0AB38EL56_9PSED|nr:type III effector HopAS1 [Pseudomonas syringae pv. persicae]SOQ15057.1 type III effector HopAS1 [Pseudomonas syringae pv. persicae]